MRSVIPAGLAVVFALSVSVPLASAQLLYQLDAGPATFNFNTLPASGTANSFASLPIGTIFSESGAGSTITYAASDGSNANNNTYSYGTGTNTERAFGELTGTTVQSILGVGFVNNTGFPVPRFTISFTGEQWRLGATGGTLDKLDLQFSTNATSITAGTWTDVNTLDFITPNNTSSAGPLNGNAAANRTVFSPTAIIPAVPVPQGGFFWLRWVPSNIAGANDGLAIDDLTVRPQFGFGNAIGGDWFVAANWFEGVVPNGVGAVGILGRVLSSPRTVYADTNLTLGTLRFDNENSYNLTGAAALSMEVSSGSASINVVLGSHKINLPMTLKDNTTATVVSGSTLTIANPMTINNGVTFTTGGAGTVSIEAPVTNLANAALFVAGGTLQAKMDVGAVALQVNAGEARFEATQRPASLDIATAGLATIVDVPSPIVLKTASLALAGNGKLDVSDNGAIVTWSGASPLASIRAAIISAYANGAWTGPGIGSSAALANAQTAVGYAERSQVGSPATFLGEGVAGNAVLLRWTLKSDANLNGTVGFEDLVVLAQAYDEANATRAWFNGDSTYDGIVGFADLVALAQNYNGTVNVEQAALLGNIGGADFVADWALAQSLVPEPAALTSFIALAILSGRRRAGRSMRRFS